MKINLHDASFNLHFAPLTLLKPMGKLWMGHFTFEQRWKMYFPNAEIGFVTVDYLTESFPALPTADWEVDTRVIPSENLIQFVRENGPGKYFWNNRWLLTAGNGSDTYQVPFTPLIINQRWDLFKLNPLLLSMDFGLHSKVKVGTSMSKTNTLIGEPSELFIHPSAKVEAAVLNVTEGPIYIDENAEIMEGSLLRGPLYIGAKSSVKMGAKLYGGSTFAPQVKVGGEVSNSVIQPYSNKGHDGFLGNALIGAWCNLGADTNTSNLKNNYSTIKTYDYQEKKEIQTAEQFMGLTMGDHSKCGINTMFNTATVVGVSCNVFGGTFPKKHISSFSWGGDNWTVFEFEKAVQSANAMMQRRNLQLSEQEVRVMRHVYDRRSEE